MRGGALGPARMRNTADAPVEPDVLRDGRRPPSAPPRTTARRGAGTDGKLRPQSGLLAA